MADENSVRRDLSRLLGTAVTADSSIMNECTQICSDYNISGEDLFFKWEAFSFNNVPAAPTAGTSRTIQSLTLDGAKALRAHIARDVARHKERRVGATRANNARLRGSTRPAHPARREGAPNPLALPPAGTSRNDRIAPPVVSSVRFVGPTSDEISRRSYRYMFEKVSMRSEVLDDRIEEISDLVRNKYGIEELGDPASVTEDIVTVVGRICLDAEASSSSGKLSSDNMVLEASRLGGSGERVGLKFDSGFTVRETQGTRTNKSLFPGEIVAFKGRNGAGNLFVVNEILQIPPIASAPDPTVKDTSILVASGPYSSPQALDFSSFNSIIEEAKNTRPSVLLLLGPFIDASHHVIKSGKLSSSPLSIFQQAFLYPIQSLLQKHPDMMILLVPSVRDLLSGHNVFPQGAEDSDFGPLPAAIKVLPNPSLFSLNGIRFAVSTVDVLFHLKSQQHIQWPQQPPSAPASISQGPLDAMADLCRHLLEQRSFYPLFPVPLDFSGDINLDVSHSEHLTLGDPAPDVLVLSSTFRQFFKSVEGVSVLNPSAFGKSHIVAHLLIPASRGGDDKVSDRAQVDLKGLA